MPAERTGGLYLAEPAGRYARHPPLVVDCSVLTAYDAAYLQLALDFGAPLATFDRSLGLAALNEVGANDKQE